jgi:hypothetical protein
LAVSHRVSPSNRYRAVPPPVLTVDSPRGGPNPRRWRATVTPTAIAMFIPSHETAKTDFGIHDLRGKLTFPDDILSPDFLYNIEII